MRILRVAAFVFALAHFAVAQRVSVSEIQAGQPAEVQLSELHPASFAVLELRLSDSATDQPRILRRLVSVNQVGVASHKFQVPATSGAATWQLRTWSLSSNGGFSVTQAAGTALPAGAIKKGPLSDDFEGSTLDPSWSFLHPSKMSHQVSGGAMHLTPTQTGSDATWFSDQEGPLIYKTVEGDFDARATVHARSALVPGANVPIRFRLGGLTARNPNSVPGARSWSHIVIGGGNSTVPVALEDKTTYDSVSDWFFVPIATMDMELRVTRVGDLLSRMYRLPGTSNWSLLRADMHPEFGPTTQIGMMAYSFDAPADITVSFDEFTFH